MINYTSKIVSLKSMITNYSLLLPKTQDQLDVLDKELNQNLPLGVRVRLLHSSFMTIQQEQVGKKLKPSHMQELFGLTVEKPKLVHGRSIQFLLNNQLVSMVSLKSLEPMVERS